MLVTVKIFSAPERSQYQKARTVAVTTYWLFGFIPVYQRERLLDYG